MLTPLIKQKASENRLFEILGLATEKRVAYEETRFEKVPALLILTELEVLKDDSSGFCMAEYLEKTVLCKLYRLAGVKYNRRLPQI